MNALAPVSVKARWAGWILGVLPGLMMFFSAAMTLPPGVPEHFTHDCARSCPSALTPAESKSP